MKNQRFIIKNYINLICVIVFCVVLFSNKAEAKQSIMAKKNILLDCDDFYGDEEVITTYDYSFSINESFILAVPIKVELSEDDEDDDMCFEGGFKIQLFNENGKCIQNDSTSLKGYTTKDTYEGFFYSDGFYVPAGNYTYRIENTSDFDLDIEFAIDAYKKVSSNAKLSKNVKINSGTWKKIGKLSSGEYPYVKNIKSQKKNLIKAWDIDYKGNIYVYGYKPGSGQVIVSLKNGKKIKTKIKVNPPEPNFYAQLYDYNTRDNYFTVRIKNVGVGDLKIHSAGAYSMDVDYKSYDRNLYLSGKKDIIIKPGKSKNVKFKVNGKTTWYKYSEHTIRFYFTYYNKKYLCSTWDEDSVYNKGKKWYSTYWNQEKYENWCQ